MLKHPVPVATILGLLAAGHAFAQDGGPGAFLADDGTMLRVSQMIGVDVIGLDHHRIGDVDDVLIDRQGRVHAVVIGTGGVLGVGGRQVAVPLDRLLWNPGDVSRSPAPASSASPGGVPGREAAERLAPERMPGAEVRNEVLRAEADPGRTGPETGPVVTGSAEPATAPVARPDGELRRAQIRMTKAEVDAAPAFRAEGR